MATATKAAPKAAPKSQPFALKTVTVEGRSAFVLVNDKGAPVGITFSATKANRMLAFRLEQLAAKATTEG